MSPRALRAAHYRVELSQHIVHRQDPRFLSVTIDTSVLIGGRWWGESKGTKEGLAHDRVQPLDLQNPALAQWAGHLAPALIRLGGTEADRILYGFWKQTGPKLEVTPGSTFVLKSKLWDQFNRWAAERGFEVLFTVSAGPEARDDQGRWLPDGAERLIRKTVSKGYPVVAWELGNEVNAYPFLYGLKRAVSARQYLADFGVFADLVRRLAPQTRTVGPASAIWPLIGEPNPLLPALGRSPVAALLDVMSFHYYPQQSHRGRVAVRRAKEATLLNSRVLNGALRWIRHARKALSQGAARRSPLWLTEVGHALYGGEPGISDTWLSTPWWLDQLGLLSHAGVEAVFRQSLIGGDYGLLDPTGTTPRPDYFASLLWKAHMGPLVHRQPTVSGPDRRLRVWHHSWPDGRQALVVINLHRRRRAEVDLRWVQGRYSLLCPESGFSSARATLNGAVLEGAQGVDAVRQARGSLPVNGPVLVPPLGAALIEVTSTAGLSAARQ